MSVSQVANMAYELEQQRLRMTHVKVSPVFTGRGRLYASLALPENLKIVNVLRNKENLMDLGAAFVCSGDEIVCLCDCEEQTRRYFMFGSI